MKKKISPACGARAEYAHPSGDGKGGEEKGASGGYVRYQVGLGNAAENCYGTEKKDLELIGRLKVLDLLASNSYLAHSSQRGSPKSTKDLG